MEVDLAYAAATGQLQGKCLNAATDIETIMKNCPMDAWARERLFETAQTLRLAVKTTDALIEKAEAA